MAHIYRLGYALLAVFLLVLWTMEPASAFAPPPPKTVYMFPGQTIGYASAQEAQNARIASANAPGSVFTYSDYGYTSGYWFMNYFCNDPYTCGGPTLITGSSSTRAVVSQITEASGTCPAPSSLIAGNCSCPSGYSDTGASCVVNSGAASAAAKAVADALNMIDATIQYTSSVPKLTACYGGQIVKGTTSGCLGGSCSMSGPFEGGSGPCSGGAGGSAGSTPAVDATPSNCAPGTAPGIVNGIGICAKAESGNEVKSSSVSGTSTLPASSTPTFAGTMPCNLGETLIDLLGQSVCAENATGKATSDTSCAGKVCTTTTAITASNGGVSNTKTSTSVQTQDDFCAKNPKSSMCITSTFNGQCGAPAACTGDAVQCAIASAAQRTNCELFEKTGRQVDKYFAAVASDGGSQVGVSVVNISSSSFDQTNALGVGASCVTDKTITFGPSGHTFTASLPLSRVCEYLGWIGYLNLAVAFILAARIVGRG